MCKYCEQVPDYDPYSPADYWDNEIDLSIVSTWPKLRMGVSPDHRYYIAACGDDRAWYYPKYCPECGRKL